MKELSHSRHLQKLYLLGAGFVFGAGMFVHWLFPVIAVAVALMWFPNNDPIDKEPVV
jgi:hypothetical protein